MLPEPKSLWDFDEATHYFSAVEAFGIVVGDTWVTRRLAVGLRRLRDGEPASGTRLQDEAAAATLD